MELLDYLTRKVAEGETTPELSARAAASLGVVAASVGGRIPPPDCSVGPEGMILLTWDNGPHHAELEFLPGEPTTFFYTHRDGGGRTYNTEYETLTTLSEKDRTHLLLFAPAPA